MADSQVYPTSTMFQNIFSRRVEAFEGGAIDYGTLFHLLKAFLLT
jgi:hypothetical protein